MFLSRHNLTSIHLLFVPQKTSQGVLSVLNVLNVLNVLASFWGTGISEREYKLIDINNIIYILIMLYIRYANFEWRLWQKCVFDKKCH